MARIRLTFALAAALAWAAPLAGQPASNETPPAAEAIGAELDAYGQWLGRLRAIEQPVQAELGGIGQAWQAAQAEGGGPREAAARFRPVIARGLATVDAANAQLQALGTPQMDAIDLPAEIRPAVLLDHMLRLNGEIRTVIEGFNPMLDALDRNDTAGVEQAAIRTLEGLRLIIESQVVLTRAELASVSREESMWEVTNFKLIYLQASARVFRAYRPFDPPQVDEDLPRELLAFATQLELDARAGSEKIETELADYSAVLAETEQGGDSSQIGLLRRVIAVFGVNRSYFSLARDLATLLRSEAPLFRGRPVTQESFARFFGQLQRIRARMEEVTDREQAALAEAQ